MLTPLVCASTAPGPAGEPLNSPMVTLVTNALQYYLSLGELSSNESY